MLLHVGLHSINPPYILSSMREMISLVLNEMDGRWSSGMRVKVVMAGELVRDQVYTERKR
jgi:hypothetical protein